MARVAKLWITDNNYYVRRGYPFTGPNGEEDSFVRTYHVTPKGSFVIENLRWRDEKELPKSIFYALVVDGDLFYPNRVPPSIASVPAEIVITARHYCDEKVFADARRKLQITEYMTLAEMVRSLQVRFRGKGLEKIAELAGYWRLGSADEAHRRNLLVKHLKDKARMGQLDKLYAFEVEALLKEIPPSFKQNHGVADFLKAKYSFLPEKFVQQLAGEYLARRTRSE
jgi:hypothetical protein